MIQSFSGLSVMVCQGFAIFDDSYQVLELKKLLSVVLPRPKDMFPE